MRHTHGTPSATDHKPHSPAAPAARQRAGLGRVKRRIALAACLLAGLLPAGPGPGFAQGAAHVGEDYINNPLHVGAQNGTSAAAEPGAALALNAAELLDPDSRLWAGAQALRLTHGQAQRLLIDKVIAGTGDGHAAAAARADGSLRIFGPYACSSARIPGGQPALALALAARGGILAAWAQGANDIIFYELGTAGCAATMSAAPFSGEADIALNPAGDLLAAHDSAGSLWLGQRGGELRVVARMPSPLALLSFSESGGTLAAIGATGRGGVWNARSGAMLRSLNVVGGPFRAGALRGGDAWLRRQDGATVRWNLLHDVAAGEAEHEPQRDHEWAELRGDALYLVSTRRKWFAEPVYELTQPLLDWSARGKALRLRDVDGLVRYYDAQSGKPMLQVLAEDWTGVPIDSQGLARLQGRSFRVFDRLRGTGHGAAADSQVYSRAVSASSVLLWTSRVPGGEIRVKSAEPRLQSVADEPLDLPLRTGLEDAPVARTLRIK